MPFSALKKHPKIGSTIHGTFITYSRHDASFLVSLLPQFESVQESSEYINQRAYSYVHVSNYATFSELIPGKDTLLKLFEYTVTRN